MSEGQRMMEAWRSWLKTHEGIACTVGEATGYYLKNRLERAFMQGWTEGRIDAKVNPPSAADSRPEEK